MNDIKHSVASDELKNATVKAMNQAITEFQSNPFSFLVENDIQSFIYYKTNENINFKKVEFVFHPFDESTKINQKISYIYTEYHPCRPSKEINNNARIDIVCLDPEKMKSMVDIKSYKYYTRPQDTEAIGWLYSLPPLIGIEIKYLWYGTKDGARDIIADFEKLQKFDSLQNKIAIGFVHTQEKFNHVFEHFQKDSNFTTNWTSEVTDLNSIYVIPHQARREGQVLMVKKI